MECKINKHGVTPFCGTDFTNWLFRIKLILEEQDLLETIEKKGELTEKEKKNNIKAKNIIAQCIADTHLELIQECQTACDMIKKLKSTYQRTGIASQLLLRKRLLTIKYSEDQKIETFFITFDKLVRELKGSGAEPSESEIICYLLLSMPKTYDNVVTAIETISSQELTIEFVKTRLTEEDIKINGFRNQNERQELNAFRTYKQPEMRQNIRTNMFNFECYNCGKKGHKKIDCKFNQPRENYRKAHNTEGETEFENKKGNMHNNNINCFMMNDCIEECSKKIHFYVDSGASDHLINDDSYFHHFITLQNPIKINIAKKSEALYATKLGMIKTENCNLNNVLFVPDLRNNLLSVRKIENYGLGVKFENNKVIIYRNQYVIKEGRPKNNLYEVIFKVTEDHTAQKAYCIPESDEIWHRRLGHASTDKLKELKQRKLIFCDASQSDILCEPCIKGRHSRTPFQKDYTHTRRVLEVVHSDLCGPINPVTHDNKKYILTFLDDFTHFTVLYLIENKSEVLEYFKKYVEMVEARFSSRISRLRCDNGGEYVNNQTRIYCETKGIQIENTIPYSPQQNGKAERLNRTIVEKARTLLVDSIFQKNMWGEAVYASIYAINRIPTVEKIIPAEIWFQRTPDYARFRIFGSVAYAHINKETREGKMSEKSRKLYFIGYCNNGYRLWDDQNKKVVSSRDVIVNEQPSHKNTIYIDSKFLEQNSEIQDKVTTDQNTESPENITPEQNSKDQKNATTEQDAEVKEPGVDNLPGVDKRSRRRPVYLQDYECDDFHDCDFTAFNITENVPKNMKEALESNEKEEWIKAVQAELDSLEKHSTWTIVEKPRDKKIIHSRWVFRKKDENIYKARLVAKGYESNEWSDTYAPVGKLTTLRTLLIIANREGMHVEQMDVKTAFLHGTLNEEIYMHLPEHMKSDKSVCKLNKSLYGLRQSPRCWNNAFHEFMIANGFRCSAYDTCLYIRSDEKLYVFLYVDDILIINADKYKIETFKTKLSSKFDMVSIGPIKRYLGLEIERDFENKTIKIHQKSYIIELLKRFEMEKCKGAATPVEKGLKLEKETNPQKFTKKPYRELIGCLMYLVMGTRPDLSYSVNLFSRYQDSANDNHWNHLKRVLKYLKFTMELGLCYKNTFVGEFNVKGYSDSDWASDCNDRKSVSGFCMTLFGNIVIWASRKQKTVALSTAEAEYVALSSLVSEAIWYRGLVSDLNVSCPTILILEDNQSCIHIAKNRECKRVKHIDIKHYFIRDTIQRGDVAIEYIGSSDQPADLFTKALGKELLIRHRNSIGLDIIT